MQRVMIVGQPGSGKSTLAVRLGEVSGLPVFHMDKIHYLAGWVERPRDEKTMMARAVHAQPQWIFEGGHSATYAERIARAEIFIWLDVPLWKRVYRVLRRAYTNRGQTRPDMADGCPERFNWTTVQFLGFIWRTRHSARRKLLAVFENPPKHLQVVRLSTLSDTDTFLEQISTQLQRQASA